MANVTDPLARPIHGTNPQNLIEYITRQRIYDSQYWKEHLFGCTAADVAEKAVTHLKAIGGSYGGNAKPTRFLSLVLKMLQIQPDDGIVDQLIANENFKYVRALGAFYLRLTGRPADIYEKLDPLYKDYRKLRYRHPQDWELLHVDDFIDLLLTEDRVCGIALPRLPKRDVLIEAGYLDGSRVNTVCTKFGIIGLEGESNHEGQDKFDQCKESIMKIESLMKKNARNGVEQAKEFLLKRGFTESSFMDANDEKEIQRRSENSSAAKERQYQIQNEQHIGSPHDHEGKKRNSDDLSSSQEERKKKAKKKKKFGSLFKSSVTDKGSTASSGETHDSVEEGSDEYWNLQRAKLGLKPLHE